MIKSANFLLWMLPVEWDLGQVDFYSRGPRGVALSIRHMEPLENKWCDQIRGLSEGLEVSDQETYYLIILQD